MLRRVYTQTAKLASKMGHQSIPLITSAELASIVKSDKKPWQDYLVVDVRDSDWKGGNIKGSHHLPSLKFESRVDELINKTKDVPVVVFHCKFSQQRGPDAARLYDAKRSRQDGEEHQHQKVYVLQGGFCTFGNHFKDDPTLVENWDENTVIW